MNAKKLLKLGFLIKSGFVRIRRLEIGKKDKRLKKDLLIEVLCEELPAIPFLKEESQILQKWIRIADSFRLSANFEFFYTPRRLVLMSRDFPMMQTEEEIEFFGPPIGIAYVQGDKNQGLSKAGESFLKKYNITQAQSKIKDGKEVMYFSQKIQGRKSEELLEEMIMQWLQSLHFGKSMRWGSQPDYFIRPIRNLLVLLDQEALEINLWGIKSHCHTFVHRDYGFEAQKVSNIKDYLETLKQGGVILDPKMRRSKILQEIAEIENCHEVEIELDEELLSEVIAITEYPSALYGEFDQEFLNLPKEIIVTSMKENQRYFALYKQGKLHHGFVVVINSMSKDLSLIIQGNQKVLRARLSDAMFFYQNDLKKPLSSYDLSKITFVEGLGSMQDKVNREKQIALYLLRGQENLDVLEAISISKSDLLSEVVGEFPSLQGIMGSYYAINEDKKGIAYRNALVSCAIKEQYFHGKDGDIGLSSLNSAYVALSFRLETLLSLFSIGKIPSGSKDPYALRRAGNAVLKILQAYPIALSQEDLCSLAKHYQAFDSSKLWEFLLERMEGVLGINASILRSVIRGREKDLRGIMQKSLALNEVFEETDKEAMIATFKRVANITKDIVEQKIDPGLFQTPQEQKLYECIQDIKKEEFLEIKFYLYALFSLKDPLESFFDGVMVNVEDEAIKNNRKALIYEIYLMFLEVSDIKEISN